METLIINIPESKSALIKQLLIELGAEIDPKVKGKGKSPNALTRKTIEDARKGKGIGKPIEDIKLFLKSL